MKNRTLVNGILLKSFADTPQGQCLQILDDDQTPTEEKILRIVDLLLQVPIEQVADLVCATVAANPTQTTSLVRMFVKTFNGVVQGEELAAESERVYTVLAGLLRAEFGLDMDRAHPGVAVTPANIFELAAMRGVSILAMPANFSGAFSNQLAMYLTPTDACDTLERARFAVAVGECLVAVGNNGTCRGLLHPKYLLGQVAIEIGVKSRTLFTEAMFYHWLAHVGAGLNLMAGLLGVMHHAQTTARAQAQWAIHGRLQ